MKVNLKKIGAIVAGAAVLASGAAFAGLMFGSTTLVDSNGAPVAKVVVGSQADPSDGVAAALIAGKMVSETYKSQALTAQVSGTAACKAGNASAGGSTCTLSNKKATLEITVPGSVASGTWTVSNLIGDYLDRTLWDRKNRNSSDTTVSYPLGTSDTSDSANPFTDGNGNTLGSSDVAFYKIGPEFPVFASQTLTDKQSGNVYTEMQSMWLEGDNHFDTSPKDIVGKLSVLAYALKFDGPGSNQLGIPVCTKPDTNSSYASCASTSSDRTSAHKLNVWFLGDKWIISDMTAPSVSGSTNLNGNVTTESLLARGGSVKLAKESVSGILNQGESLPVDDLKVRLDDLEAHGETTSAIISLVDANGNVLLQDTVTPGTTDEKTVNGKKYRFHVYKVAPGYTFGAKWADMAVYAQELQLDDNKDLDSVNNNNKGWHVSLGWKNRDATSTSNAPDSLRSIVIWTDNVGQVSSNGQDTLKVGDYVPLVLTPKVWQLSYKGLDLTSADRSNLRFQIKSSAKSIPAGSGPTVNSSASMCTIFAPYVQVTSGDTGSIFRVSRTDGSGELSNNEFFVTLNDGNTSEVTSAGALTNGNKGAVCDYNHDSVVNLTDVTAGGGLPPGVVFMYVSPSTTSFGFANYSATAGVQVKYDKIGDGSTAFAPSNGGAILIEYGNLVNTSDDGLIGDIIRSSGATCNAVNACGERPIGSTGSVVKPSVWFGVAEKAGTGTSNNYVDYYMFAVDKVGSSTATDATFQFTSTDNSGAYTLTSDNHKILYGHATANSAPNQYNGTLASGPVQSKIAMVDEGYVSERGSVFTSQSTDTVQFNMANKLGHAQWFLAPVSTSSGSASTTVATLGEGESTTVGSVTVKVTSIKADLGAGCSAAGAAPACTADMSPVSAVIMPNNAASVSVAMPYDYSKYGNLVILDQDAAGVNTLVSVGGDKVNSVTANLMQGSAVDWAAQKKVVKEMVQGSKIVVAGAEKEDTLSAAQDFVAQLKKV
ncbi:hypothetical protein HY988_01680 [Candidatus Micrarchaeota archaeon]|nr:hypothetical protein [Candidatus Micrarchaeota archaeon]